MTVLPFSFSAPAQPSAPRGPRLREITLQYTPKRGIDGRAVYLGPRITNSWSAAQLLAQVLAHEPVEVFGILCLTVRSRVIGWREISRGTVDSVRVRARDVFQVALMSNAASLILAHNHPSGEAAPTCHDVDMTRRLIGVSALIGINVLDHIIIGDGEFTSIRLAMYERRKNGANVCGRLV